MNADEREKERSEKYGQYRYNTPEAEALDFLERGLIGVLARVQHRLVRSFVRGRTLPAYFTLRSDEMN